MMMHIPPELAGQTIEVSYGYDHAGYIYRRTLDRFDRSVAWQRAPLEDISEELSDPWNTIPGVPEDLWEDCEEP